MTNKFYTEVWNSWGRHQRVTVVPKHTDPCGLYIFQALRMDKHDEPVEVSRFFIGFAVQLGHNITSFNACAAAPTLDQAMYRLNQAKALWGDWQCKAARDAMPYETTRRLYVLRQQSFADSPY